MANTAGERKMVLVGPEYFETYLNKMLSLEERTKMMQRDLAYQKLLSGMDFEDIQKQFSEMMLKNETSITEVIEESAEKVEEALKEEASEN